MDFTDSISKSCPVTVGISLPAEQSDVNTALASVSYVDNMP
ncbi:MAG: hypothetical protein N2738_07870 [Thermodesulfovibrionales bacterium]|nr:hypothetical protein [Thermodesulfovibrionales bacterium]